MDECKNRDKRALDLDGVGEMTQREKFEKWANRRFGDDLSKRVFRNNPVHMEIWLESAKQQEEEIERLRSEIERMRAELMEWWFNHKENAHFFNRMMAASPELVKQCNDEFLKEAP